MRTYRSVVRFLKKTCPPDLPVCVRRVSLPKHLDGDCQRKNDRYLIRIEKNLPEHEAIDTLLHEFAHAHAWHDFKECHSREWGIAYAAIYRRFLKEFLGTAI